MASILLALATLVPGSARAQVIQSERAVVSQTIDGTTITIEYARPRIRDRGEPFGDIVRIGDHRWTPGADMASTITSNRPFELNGHRVPDGTWSMWIDLEEDAWTMILDPGDSIFHTVPPEDSDEQIRFEVEPRQLAEDEGRFIESMLFWIPETRLSGFDLLLTWGRTEIPFDVRVEPTFTTTVSAEVGEPLIGSYELSLTGPGGPGDGPPPPTVPFDVSWSDGHLQVETESIGEGEPMMAWLLPRGEDVYYFGELKDGEVYNILSDLFFEPVRGPDGEVTGFEVRWPNDMLIGRIRRR